MEFNGSENSPVNHCSPNRKAYTEPILPKVNLIASLAETLGRFTASSFHSYSSFILIREKRMEKEIGKKEKKKGNKSILYRASSH
ncbi:hypothetical protein CEXT_8671 [Caerostris extrusa]|uniref:Uncharacterized protein n=1 Tax=Caerostris extrusa TaxID=172846 RepID=A0AAV4UVW2_CAEEX|nr:hypothetical protein CEXT_8671 [Caerostris extrusa]